MIENPRYSIEFSFPLLLAFYFFRYCLSSYSTVYVLSLDEFQNWQTNVSKSAPIKQMNKLKYKIKSKNERKRKKEKERCFRFAYFGIDWFWRWIIKLIWPFKATLRSICIKVCVSVCVCICDLATANKSPNQNRVNISLSNELKTKNLFTSNKDLFFKSDNSRINLSIANWIESNDNDNDQIEIIAIVQFDN